MRILHSNLFYYISTTLKNFFIKNTTSGKQLIYNTSCLLCIPTYPLNPLIFGTKRLLCRRFLQHYYRDTFIESHRKPRDVPQISYSGRLICKSLFLYQRYTKGIQKASIYLKTQNICITQNKSLSLQRKIRKIISNSTSKCSKKSFHIISPHRLRIS